MMACVILCHQTLFKRLTHLRTVCINHVYAHLRVHMYNGCSCNKVAHKFCAKQRLVEQIAVMYSHRSIRTWRRQWTRHSSCQTVLSTAAYLSLKADSSAGSCCASRATSSSSDAAGTGTDTRAARSARPVSPTPRRQGVARKCRTASGSGPGTTCRRCSSRAVSPWVGQGRVCRWRSYCNIKNGRFFTNSYV